MGDAEHHPSFQDGTGFLLSRLGRLVERAWASLLTRHELTQAQYLALGVLAASGPTGQGRLAQLIAVDPRNVVAVVDSLEARGMVERRASAVDGRRREIHLTAAGRRIQDAVAREAKNEQAAFLAGLGREDQVTLNELLRRVYHTRVDDE
ncbi:MAG: MarR family winged helix-turn-helix transcriptional regulator [Acidimicrobiia bacterium]|jgi:DNA-binding MarR family transcriptional regulator